MKRAIVFAVLVLTVFAGAVSQVGAQEQEQEQPRLALVVGQSAYEGRPLATAANDAGLIAQALTSAGFEVVQGRDLNANDLRRVVRDFLDKAQELPSDGAVAVYLSGYGLQLEGENYLLPVDARIQRDVDVPIDGFRLSDLVRSLESTPAQARIIVADMTRDYPLPTGGEPLARGLALMEPPAGFLIAFSSAPGITNGDAPGPYGHYATALAEMMRQPGVPVDEMFNRVRLRTHETTQGLQTPWHKANLGNAPFTFFEAEETASALPPAPQLRRIEEVPAEEAYNIAVERDTIQDYQAFLRRYSDHPLARRVSALLAARREAIVWRQTVARNTSEAYWTYLRRYPNGPHAADSRRRLARLSAPVAPPQVFQEIVYEDLPPPLPGVERIEVVEVVTIIRDAPPPPRPPVYLLPAYEEDVEFVTIIREPPPPPIMVGVLPVPAPLPLPRYARPPRYYYEPIAPVTPRGPMAIPVRAPGIAGPLLGRPGEPRPARGRRPEPVVPRQPGLAAQPKPIPAVARPPAMQAPTTARNLSEGRDTPRVKEQRLPSRRIPLPSAQRPAAERPASRPKPEAKPAAPRPNAPAAERPRPAVEDKREATPRPSLPTAPRPGRPPLAPSARDVTDSGSRNPRRGIEQDRPAIPRTPRVGEDRERPTPRPSRSVDGDGRPATPRLPSERVQDARPDRPRPARPSVKEEERPRPARPAVLPKPKPRVQERAARPAMPRPAPRVEERPAQPRVSNTREISRGADAPQARESRPSRPNVQPRPAPEARSAAPRAPAAREAPRRPQASSGAPNKRECQPGRPCPRN